MNHHTAESEAISGARQGAEDTRQLAAFVADAVRGVMADAVAEGVLQALEDVQGKGSDRAMTAQDVARETKQCVATVWRAMRSGKLRSVRPGGGPRRRTYKSWVDEWVGGLQ